jgi:hypothetical protein
MEIETTSFFATVGVTVGLFALSMAAMAVGLLICGRVMRGGCGSKLGADGEEHCVCGGTGGEDCRRNRTSRRAAQSGKPDVTRSA